MSIQIDFFRVRLIYCTNPLTKGQRAALDLLVGFIEDDYSYVTSGMLIKELKFSSPLPLISRINHLIESGYLQIV